MKKHLSNKEEKEIRKEFEEKFLVQNEDGDMEFISDYLRPKQERNPKTGYGYYLVRDVWSFFESHLTQATNEGIKIGREEIVALIKKKKKYSYNSNKPEYRMTRRFVKETLESLDKNKKGTLNYCHLKKGSKKEERKSDIIST